jgi:hypothetical protein
LICKESSPILCPGPIPVTPEPASNCSYYIRASEYVFNMEMDTIFRCGMLQHSFCSPSELTSVQHSLCYNMHNYYTAVA